MDVLHTTLGMRMAPLALNLYKYAVVSRYRPNN